MTPMEQRDVIDRLVGLVEQHYVFPDVAARLAGTLSAEHADGTLEGFAAAITTQLQSVNGDKHLRLIHHADPLPANYGEDDDEAERAVMRQLSRTSAAGFARVQRLAGNVGYVDIRLLFPPDLGGDRVVSVMTILSDVDALLLDLRACRGGEPSAVALLCGYLFDDSVELSGIYDRDTDRVQQWWTPAYLGGPRFGGAKPVYILTSGATFSGGEQVAYDLQQMRRGTLVGERTRGGAHPRRGFRVHEHLEAAIPVGRAVSPRTGGNWEGVGVTPDIEVASADAPRVAYRMALEHTLTAGSATADVLAEARAALDAGGDPLAAQ
jgi:C-terminal processing protease CtpA/Prc